MKYLLTAGKFCKKREKSFSKLDDKTIAEDFKQAIRAKRKTNMRRTLAIIKNYLISEELRATGLLYSDKDDLILSKAQNLFWEWKKEKIINEFEDFEDATKNWIMAYQN